MSGLRAKPSTFSCKRGRFRTYSGNELHDTNKHTTRYNQTKCKCVMWHVKSKHTNASMLSVCVLYISSKKTKHKYYTFECLSTLRSWRGLSMLVFNHLIYPYNSNPNLWFVHEISQSIMGILTISPFGYFVTKPPLTLILTNINEATGYST